MNKSDVDDICVQGVLVAAQEKAWSIDAEAAFTLAQIIHPFVEKGEVTIASAIEIAINYYYDGPMVQEMLTPGSSDGEMLWQEWRTYMLHLALVKQLNTEQAEDLVQEIYIRTTSALKNFRFASRLKTYFHGIFINCYRRWIRDIKGVERHEMLLPTGDDSGEDEEKKSVAIPDRRPLPETSTVQELQDTHIQHFVEQEIRKIVDSNTYQILYYYYWEQTFIDPVTCKQKKWTDEAIGKSLGLSLNTVTSKRRRALERFSNHPPLQAIWVELLDRH